MVDSPSPLPADLCHGCLLTSGGVPLHSSASSPSGPHTERASSFVINTVCVSVQGQAAVTFLLSSKQREGVFMTLESNCKISVSESDTLSHTYTHTLGEPDSPPNLKT